MKQPLYRVLAQLIAARAHCLEIVENHGPALHHAQWALQHAQDIGDLATRHLPSGAGFDDGTHVDLGASRTERLVLDTSFHHMDQYGGYDGWTRHQVIITPSLLQGLDVAVKGRDRNNIKDHIADVMYGALGTLVEDNVASDPCHARLLRSVARGRRRHPQHKEPAK